MAAGPRLPFPWAYDLARELQFRLSTSCERVMVAGSVRRRKPTVGDLELVAIPTFGPAAQGGLFGGATVNELWARLDQIPPGALLQRHPPRAVICPVCQGAAGPPGSNPCGRCGNRGTVDRAAPWGDRYRKLLYRGVPVDLFTATTDTWGAILLIRTGPPEYSQAWVTALRAHGLQQADGRVVKLGTDEVVPVPDEATACSLVGWPLITPREREHWAGSRSWSARAGVAGR